MTRTFEHRREAWRVLACKITNTFSFRKRFGITTFFFEDHQKQSHFTKKEMSALWIITLDFFVFGRIITLDNFIFWHKSLKNILICFIAVCDERITFRILQAYEQVDQDIMKTEVRMVFALARVLEYKAGGMLWMRYKNNSA